MGVGVARGMRAAQRIFGSQFSRDGRIVPAVRHGPDSPCRATSRMRPQGVAFGSPARGQPDPAANAEPPESRQRRDPCVRRLRQPLAVPAAPSCLPEASHPRACRAATPADGTALEAAPAPWPSSRRIRRPFRAAFPPIPLRLEGMTRAPRLAKIPPNAPGTQGSAALPGSGGAKWATDGQARVAPRVSEEREDREPPWVNTIFSSAS